jgi:hypothetical protein
LSTRRPVSRASFGRTKQCAACPWKKSTNPAEDIPGGYSAEKHRKLASCGTDRDRAMACHESPRGEEQACVGWLLWAIGPGNRIDMRLAAINGIFDPSKLAVEGEQYDTIQEMLETAK